MSEFTSGPDAVDVTDSLEAASVFRAWKNLFFAILIFCMLLIQGVFWITDLGLVTQEQGDPNSIQRVQPLRAESNAASSSTVAAEGTLDGITPEHIKQALNLINGAAFLAAVLFCLTLMFSTTLTIVSRLGGIRHVCRAFFLSMIVLVFLVPWHAIIECSVPGVLFSSEDLMSAIATKLDTRYSTILYYARFCGCWTVTMLMLFVSQARLTRWNRAMQRRLEIL